MCVPALAVALMLAVPWGGPSRASVVLAAAAFPQLSPVRKEVAQSSNVFERPDLVVLVSIRDKCQSELTGIDGEALSPPRVQRLAMARVDAVMRMNQRSAASPDRSPGHLVLNLDPDLDLVLGRAYLLMLNFIRKGPLWPWASKSFPGYAMARENPGFEVDDGNVVHALRRTPESMPYDGKGVSDPGEGN
jgi:hypothetical protein